MLQVLPIANPLSGEQAHLLVRGRAGIAIDLRPELMPLLLDLLDKQDLELECLLQSSAAQAKDTVQMARAMGWAWAGPIPGWSTPGAIFRLGQRVVEVDPGAEPSTSALCSRVPVLEVELGPLVVQVLPLPGTPGHVIYRVQEHLFTGQCKPGQLQALFPGATVHRGCTRVRRGPLQGAEGDVDIPIESWGGFEPA